MGIGFADYGLERFQITPLIIHSTDVLGGVVPNYSTPQVWPVANLALFVPFTLSEMVVIKRMLVEPMGTTGGHVDVGLYAADGTRLVSMGSTLLGGPNTIQFLDIADTQLNAGRYYMAIAADSTTPKLGWGLTGFMVNSYLGIREMAAAFPLPATATFTDNTTRSHLPLVAATLTAV